MSPIQIWMFESFFRNFGSAVCDPTLWLCMTYFRWHTSEWSIVAGWSRDPQIENLKKKSWESRYKFQTKTSRCLFSLHKLSESFKNDHENSHRSRSVKNEHSVRQTRGCRSFWEVKNRDLHEILEWYDFSTFFGPLFDLIWRGRMISRRVWRQRYPTRFHEYLWKCTYC